MTDASQFFHSLNLPFVYFMVSNLKPRPSQLPGSNSFSPNVHELELVSVTLDVMATWIRDFRRHMVLGYGTSSSLMRDLSGIPARKGLPGNRR